MSFKISMIEGLPVWDSLPVAKITDYPLEPRDYRPFAQARLCVSAQSLWVRLWSFEAIPTPTSTLMVRLNLFPEESRNWLSLLISNGGECVCEVWKDGRMIPMAELLCLPRVKMFQSEDLQGLYWGVVFELPLTLLAPLYGRNDLAAGGRVTGNFYKLDRSENGRHYGSFYPVCYDVFEDAFTERYFGEFELVRY